MVKRLKLLNNWLLLGIVLLIIADATALIGWAGLSLTVLVMGFIFYPLGLYVAWFNTRGAKKLKKKSS